MLDCVQYSHLNLKLLFFQDMLSNATSGKYQFVLLVYYFVVVQIQLCKYCLDKLRQCVGFPLPNCVFFTCLIFLIYNIVYLIILANRRSFLKLSLQAFEAIKKSLQENVGRITQLSKHMTSVISTTGKYVNYVYNVI